jgi:hypothetical protein
LILKRIPLKWGMAPYYLLLIAAISPAVIALGVQNRHWINIPIWDEWDTPGITLLHYVQHRLTWGDLLAQHNESRKLFARLIYIAIYSVAGWDVRHGMALTFLCACAASAFALVQLRRCTGIANNQVLFAWLLINFLLFAPSQYENFLSGFAFEIFIPFLCLFGCIAINLSNWRLPAKVVGNSLLALLANYTFVHGILLWPLALPIPTREENDHRTRMRIILPCWFAYGAAGIVSIAYYFLGYHRPEIASPAAGLRQFPQIIEFIVVWLGAVVRSAWVEPRVSGTIASTALIVVTFSALIFLRCNKSRWRNYYPWMLIGIFSLATGALTAVGRVGIGTDLVFNTWFSGFSSMRYNATAVFAYVALIGLAFNLYADWLRHESDLRTTVLVTLTACCTLLGVAWSHMVSEELKRVRSFQENRKRARTAVEWIRVLPDNPEIFWAYPYPEGFWQRIDEMDRFGLIKFPILSENVRNLVSASPPLADGEAGYLDNFYSQPGGHLRFVGWARNPRKNTPADYVVLGWEDQNDSFHPLITLLTGHARPDVAKAFQSPALKNAGFDQDCDVRKLPDRTVTIKGWAIDLAQREAFPLGGSLRLRRPTQ